jgi:pteridine reductase
MTEKHKAQGTALVTGGARRIGKAICLSLSSMGYKVALHYHRSSREARKIADAIHRKGGQCKLFSCDLSDARQTDRLVPNVLKIFSKLDLLINNASVFEPSTIRGSGIASLSRHFAVNFNAPYILTARFAGECKRGHIINILDAHITGNKTRYAAYLLSKKALYELTKLSAVELAPHIRVNAVSPGLILPAAQTKSDDFERMAKKIPLKKKGHVDHIAQSITFLLNNSYVTGQVIFIDGGEHLI